MSQKFKSELELQALNNATTDTDKFLVSDGGVVKYRTGAEMLSDLGVAPGVASNIQHQVKAGVAINKGQAVYVTSADGTNMVVGLASNASEATSSKTMGLLASTVSTNGFANVIAEGLLAGLNTIGATAGDPVWLGTNGNLIYGLLNKPYAPAHLVFIGIVTRVNANNGEIFVKVQNGFELKEIHDVDLITTTPINGHLLGFNGTLWVNKTIAGWLGYTPANASGTTNYVSKFTGTTSLGDSQIFDNGTNVGIGTASPGRPLTVASSNIGIRMDNSSNSNAGLEYYVSTGTFHNWLLGAQYNVSNTFEITPSTTVGGTTYSTPAFVVNANGNVGIGDTAPSDKFVVNGRARIDGANALAFGNSAGGYAQIAVSGATTGNLVFSTYDGVSLGERMRISLAGDVAIGTSSAFTLGGTAKLSLYASGPSTFGLSSTDAVYLRRYGTGQYQFQTSANGGNNGDLSLQSYGGNVGIGTTAPTKKLEVNGSIVVGMDTPAPFWNAKFKDYSDGSAIYISAVNGGGGKYITGNAYYNNSSQWWSDKTTASAINLDNGAVVLYTNSGLTPNTDFLPSERMRITSSGDVGIGTSSPNAKLEVSAGQSFINQDYLLGWNVAGSATLRAYIIGTSGNELQFWNRQGGTNTQAITLNASGNVGIGTTSPSYKLTVRNDVNASTSLDQASIGLYNNSDGGSAIYFSNGVGGQSKLSFGVESTGAGTDDTYLGFSTGVNASLSEKMRITSAGNVGIGTTSPNEKLEILGAIRFTRTDDTAQYSTIQSNSNGSFIATSYRPYAGAGYYGDYRFNAMDSTGATITPLYINTLGNVGIGTTSPAYKLDVNGTVNIVGSFGNRGVESAYRLKFYDNGGTANDAGIGLDGYAGGGEQMWFNSLDGFYWSTGTNGEKMRITSSGNVGIGTSAPARLLELSAGEPVLRFNPTTVSGAYIFSAADGKFYFTPESSYVSTMTFSSGNVGIGTTSPSEKLHVVGNTKIEQIGDVSSYLTLNSYSSALGTGYQWQLAQGNSVNGYDFGISAGGNRYLTILNNASPNGGNVGIGTSAPDAKLRVEGVVSINGEGNGVLVDSGTTANARVGLMKYGGYEGMLIAGSGTLLRLGHRTDSVAVYGGTPTIREDLVITSVGNVGIGTTAPVSSLQVSKDQTADTAITVTNSGALGSTTSMSFVLQEAGTPQGWFRRYRDGSGLNEIGFNTDLSFSGNIATTKVERMRIAASGNVGIGTSSPAYKLEVNGKIYSSTEIQANTAVMNTTGGYASFGSNSGSVPVRIGRDTSLNDIIINAEGNVGIGTASVNSALSSTEKVLKISNTNVASIYLETNGGTIANFLNASRNLVWYDISTSLERMRLSSSGNLGIGTTSPGAKLDVEAATTGYAAIIKNTTAGGDYLKMTGDSGNTAFEFGSGGTGADAFLNMYSDNTQKVLVNADGNSYFNGGNVGIGTTSPTALLNVVGTSDMSGAFETTGTSNAASLILKSGNGTTSGLYSYVRFINNNTNQQDWRIGTYSNNNFTFHNAKAATSPMVITTTGNVGIGTTSPSAKLDVNGDALINNVTIGRGPGNISTNTALGTGALDSTTTANYNIAVGWGANTNNNANGLTAIGVDLNVGPDTGNLGQDCLAIAQFNSNADTAQVPHIYAPKPISIGGGATNIITFDLLHYAGAIVEYMIRLDDGDDYALGTVYMGWKSLGSGNMIDVRQIEWSNMSGFVFSLGGSGQTLVLTNTSGNNAWIRITVRGMMTN